MKTGIVRNLDQLGRIVIPKELRRTFNINNGDPLEFSVDGDTICLQPYRGRDTINNALENLKNVSLETTGSFTLRQKIINKVAELEEIIKENEDNETR